MRLSILVEFDLANTNSAASIVQRMVNAGGVVPDRCAINWGGDTYSLPEWARREPENRVINDADGT